MAAPVTTLLIPNGEQKRVSQVLRNFFAGRVLLWKQPQTWDGYVCTGVTLLCDLGFHPLAQDAIDLGQVGRPFTTQSAKHIGVQADRDHSLYRRVVFAAHRGRPVRFGGRRNIRGIRGAPLQRFQLRYLHFGQRMFRSGSLSTGGLHIAFALRHQLHAD